jgi:glycosyltransferase involved in cell wall biosynthesis
MKLLVITQKVNKNDPILGFFHRWIVEFSKSFESVLVICLEMGEFDLPDNVKVLSLGKEERVSKIKYMFRFYKYIWQFRKEYDTVFVHMNQEYILLGGVIWKVLGKKISMWRNHHAGNFLTDIACYLCDKIFCTSKFSYTARFKKTQFMPVGIDTDFFKVNLNVLRQPNSVLFLGRISPVKKPHIFIKALGILKKRNINFYASIYGDPLPKDEDYFNSLKTLALELNLNKEIKFERGVPNDKTVDVYNTHKAYVNLSSSGMYDKTIFEAMACGCTIFASNDNLKGQIDDFYVLPQDNEEELALRLEQYFFGKVLIKGNFEKYVQENHSLKELAKKLNKSLC